MMSQSSNTGQRRLEALKRILLSRFTDEKMAKLVRQNKGGTFQLSAAGHELVGVVGALHLRAGSDWAFPYYRDQPFAIALGCELAELFGVFLGRATKNHSSGRMMPHHFSHRALRIFCQSSVVGSQFLQAAGRGLAIKNLGLDEIVYVSGGEGSTSQGDFHEALNFAAIHRLPVVFVIQDNGWAISVPHYEQSAGSSLASVARGYQGLEVFEVDGTSFDAVDTVFGEAVARARSHQGASVVFAKVPRLAAHSNSDDPKKYKSADMELLDQQRDPLLCVEQQCLAEGDITPEALVALRTAIQEEVERAALEADALPFPEKGSSRRHVFIPFESKSAKAVEIPSTGEKVVMIDAINHALDEEMALDPHVVVFGQDVARGKGGVFGATRGLTEKYGAGRCFNTPLAESTIIGLGIGMGADGLHRPVAEIQFADYMWTGVNQLFNEAASIAYRSHGEWSVPLVVRMPCGGYIQGGPYHSQSIEAFLAHCPGLKVVMPSNAADAKGLLKSAIRDPNPVIFLEHKALYRQHKFSARLEPPRDYLLPFGQGVVVCAGTDLTVVAWGMTVLFALEIAEKWQSKGISIEVIDIRTMVPLDMPLIYQSVKKTSKLLIAHEAPRSGGFGAEIAARVAEEAHAYLDGPIVRVGGFESAVPYSKPLENEVLPQLTDLEEAILRQIRY